MITRLSSSLPYDLYNSSTTSIGASALYVIAIRWRPSRSTLGGRILPQMCQPISNRLLTHKKQKPGFRLASITSQVSQPLNRRFRLRLRRRLQDDPSTRCTPSVHCHQREIPSSRYAGNHHYDWRNAGRVRQTASTPFRGRASG